jgi:two-component system, OmpR family, sensor histidine kinase MtrB
VPEVATGGAEGRQRFPTRLRNRIVVRIALLVAGLALVVGIGTYAIVSDALRSQEERVAAGESGPGGATDPELITEDTLSTLRRALVASGMGATAAAVVVAWLIARRVTAPLEGVAHAATRIASGDLDVRLASSDDRDLARIATSFNRMADSLQDRIGRESRFAADVSHELRSPMTTLVNAATVLQHRREQLSEDGQEALDLLAGDVERLERVIADLTEMSKHDAGTFHPDAEVLPAARTVREALRRSGRDHLVRIDGAGDDAEPARVMVDLRVLDRILHTLIENADAYGGGTTAVVVDVGSDEVRVHVDDEGPGVPDVERERIFERFARGVHGERRTTADGSGLGLSLARENAEALGGRLEVGDNPAGAGARFTLTLPRTVT